MKDITINIKEDTCIRIITDTLGKAKYNHKQLLIYIDPKPERDDYSFSLIDGNFEKGGFLPRIIMLKDRVLKD